ncbi:HAMP domain-containing sensor histidine kinase [Inediibacterium massiliense]|uniref:HAMP domain-containing sensor histidine kinase n=1 Tax=Inediibacterium massiliense TaxID=1658111 RepID=UPI0006B681E2|nr:HAMP domain-containing sensor histidine kinase [Inediibacterium massiliense]
MDIKWKNYSHSWITKIIVFMIVILCFSSAVTLILNLIGVKEIDIELAFENNYYSGKEYRRQLESITEDAIELMNEYKSEEYILSGRTVTEEDIKTEEENLYSDFKYDEKLYNYELSDVENYKRFQEIYVDKISKIKDELIQKDLEEYKSCLNRMEQNKDFIYYLSTYVDDIKKVYSNSENISKEYFKSHPSYIIIDSSEEEIYPQNIEKTMYRYGYLSMDEVNPQNQVMYIALKEDSAHDKIEKWKKDKAIVMDYLYKIIVFVIATLASLIYLIWIIGKDYFKEKEVHLNFVDKIYNDINIAMCLSLIILWFAFMQGVFHNNLYKIIFPITFLIGTFGLILILSLAKHIKNKTLIKHTLTFKVLYKFYAFIKDIFDSGSTAVKIVVIVIGYPILVGLTFFMAPITIGIGAWVALKKVKEFNAIKEGVEKIKNGDIHHTIDISKGGEFKTLASNINSITEGLNKAVDNELKSQRLKTELITNVSHDIRTPLTSIITYVDLLKKEKDQSKREEYIEIIDQKSQRLKILTDDLFEASKASSGDMPVNYEKIDMTSLITQGLGELNDKIEASNLEFKINHPKDKVYVKADGKLLWRAIENLLSNIFKYALKGSRVYIDMEELKNEVVLTVKNISAYELNISSDELMERFKRGDESRTSQGSGLGLSIAKSLVDLQRGSFRIEVDGDLFKAIIKMPKY